jgi:[acyl-carrier-protein] S-malonyltransferase
MANKAVVFSGQGAQFVGMGKELADAYPEIRRVYDLADEILGYSLSKICFDGPDEELTKSSYCQPGIFVTSIACYQALLTRLPDQEFKATAGLSLGEWTALYVAGAITFEDALRALEVRGRHMQQACEASDGAMISIMGLTLDQIEEIWQSAGIEVANLNTREQTVLSGKRKGVEKAEKLARKAGAKKTVILNVAGAFHSQLMRPAADYLAEFMAGVEIRKPTVPVLSNVTGRPHGDPKEIRNLLIRQVTHPVNWFMGIEWFASEGITHYVECGPGKVLCSLIRRTRRDAGLAHIQDMASLDKTVDALKNREWTEDKWQILTEK